MPSAIFIVESSSSGTSNAEDSKLPICCVVT
jgi:hypothetical protein